MRTAKANKILILLATLVFSVIIAVMGFNGTSAKAEGQTGLDGSPIFSYYEGGTSDDQIRTDADDNMNIPLTSGNTVIGIKNALVVEDFALEVKLSAEITKFSLVMESSAYDKNNEIVTNTLTISNTSNRLSATFNEGTAVDLGDLNASSVYAIKIERDVNLLKASVGGVAVLSGTEKDYAVENVDKTTANIRLTAESSAETNLKIKSIDQKASDLTGAYKQTFEDVEGSFKKALPRAEVSESKIKVDGSDLTVVQGDLLDVKTTTYSALSVTGAKLKTADAWVGGNDNKLSFKTLGNKTLQVVSEDGTVVYETYQVNVVDLALDDVKPSYVDDQNAYDIFREKLESSLLDSDKGTYIAIGSDKKLKLPSMEKLVSDDVTPYSQLKITVHYWTPTTYGTSSTLEIPLKDAGAYKFCVVFTDRNGNAINKDDFFTVEDGVYNFTNSKYIFNFTILDNYPLSVKASTSQGNGYIGVAYNAKSFEITAASYVAEYKLYYSAQRLASDADGWVEIPKASSVKEGDTIEGLTYDQVQKIAYDGSLKFTPDRQGYYKLVCSITSRTSARTAEDSSIIHIKDKPVIVKPDSRWLQNNVWSVVFLSVGVLSLVGIITLLCIKPKATTDED